VCDAPAVVRRSSSARLLFPKRRTRYKKVQRNEFCHSPTSSASHQHLICTCPAGSPGPRATRPLCAHTPYTLPHPLPSRRAPARSLPGTLSTWHYGIQRRWALPARARHSFTVLLHPSLKTSLRVCSLRSRSAGTRLSEDPGELRARIPRRWASCNPLLDCSHGLSGNIRFLRRAHGSVADGVAPQAVALWKLVQENCQ
jgi:hypothetical protein